MGSLWPRAAIWDPIRVAAAGSGIASLVLVGAYVVTAAYSKATVAGVVAVLSLLAIAGAGLLYAWRLGAGGLAE